MWPKAMKIVIGAWTGAAILTAFRAARTPC